MLRPPLPGLCLSRLPGKEGTPGAELPSPHTAVWKLQSRPSGREEVAVPSPVAADQCGAAFPWSFVWPVVARASRLLVLLLAASAVWFCPDRFNFPLQAFWFGIGFCTGSEAGSLFQRSLK